MWRNLPGTWQVEQQQQQLQLQSVHEWRLGYLRGLKLGPHLKRLQRSHGNARSWLRDLQSLAL